jgi:acyl-CoA synthetase (AMP-forming)/AMP-acid ligase II
LLSLIHAVTQEVSSRAEPPDLSQLTEIVYPAEVEAVLAADPAVADVAVIGVPDERWGETVHAVVVLASGALLAPGGTTPPGPPGNGAAEPGFDSDTLLSWARDRLVS